jgi:outer membrane receptor protein involved in Fe transport
LTRRLDAFYSGNNERTPFLNFNGQYTQDPIGKSPTSKAFSKADFVLNLPNDIGLGLSNGKTWGQRQSQWGLYVQDDWRVTDALTLNLGLRWEYSTPWVGVKDRQVNFGLQRANGFRRPGRK